MRPSPRLPIVIAPPPMSPSSLLCAHAVALLHTAEPRQSPLRRTQERRAAPPLPPPSPWEKQHGPIPRPAPLLNRLTAAPPPLSPASIAPLAAAPTAPAVSWLSEPLPPACKAGKTLLLDAFKLSSMAVLYLLSLGGIGIHLTGDGITSQRSA